MTVPTKPASLHFRLTDKDYHQVTMLKLKRKTSIQHLLELGLNQLLAQEGMEPIEGVPRPKRSSATMATWQHLAKSGNYS